MHIAPNMPDTLFPVYLIPIALKLLQVDAGKEYWNTTFMALMKRYKIHYYTTYSTVKAGIAERYIRELKKAFMETFFPPRFLQLHSQTGRNREGL